MTTLAFLTDLEKLLPMLTGSAGALVVSLVVNWYQNKEKIALQAIIDAFQTALGRANP
jgi:hypothetical protein